MGKKNNKNISMSEETGMSIKKKILIATIVLVCILVFYLLAVYLVNNDTSSVTSNKNKDVNAVIDYDKIIIGESFNKNKDKEYYVVYYDASDDSTKSDVTSIVATYRSDNENVYVYEVDMSSPFNSGYSTTDETNKSPSSIDELRINGITLIKFNNGKVVDYVEGIDNIKSYLGQ